MKTQLSMTTLTLTDTRWNKVETTRTARSTPSVPCAAPAPSGARVLPAKACRQNLDSRRGTRLPISVWHESSVQVLHPRAPLYQVAEVHASGSSETAVFGLVGAVVAGAIATGLVGTFSFVSQWDTFAALVRTMLA